MFLFYKILEIIIQILSWIPQRQDLQTVLCSRRLEVLKNRFTTWIGSVTHSFNNLVLNVHSIMFISSCSLCKVALEREVRCELMV